MPEQATSIDRESKLPFYFQLYEILRGKIISEQWKPGDMIPPESELIQHYKVSRITARQALDALVRDGLIFRQRGKGSFVSHPTIEQGMTRLITFTQDMQQRGFAPHTQVIDARIVPASKYIAGQLSVREGEELVYLKRLRLADNEPMCIEESYLVHKYCPNILSQDIQNRSLREILDSVFNIRWVRAKQTIRAIAATKKIAEPLSVSEGAPVLNIERVSFSEQETPVEFLQRHHRAERYALYGELRT
jgi:GntR family transcriptional regulator